METAEQLRNSVVVFMPRVLVALAVLLVFWIVFRVTRRLFASILRRAGIHQTLTHLLLDNVYRVTLAIVAIIMAASQLGLNVAAPIAGLGVAGIAVGLAAQDSIANMIAGFLIFWDKPFGVGDYLTVGELYGEVRVITIRTTRIRTNENKYVVIPNKLIMDSVLVNHTMYGEARVNVPLGIAYKENIPEAREVLLKALESVEGILTHPAPDIVVEGLGGSSVNLVVRVWIDDLSTERPVFFRTLETCKLALDAAGIQIPYPHLQLFVENVEDRVMGKLAADDTDPRNRPLLIILAYHQPVGIGHHVHALQHLPGGAGLDFAVPVVELIYDHLFVTPEEFAQRNHISAHLGD
jgi:small conductance mechanosensitive channel